MNVCEPVAPYQPTKKRALVLTTLAYQIYEKMNELGIRKEEYCHFGNVITQLLQLPD